MNECDHYSECQKSFDVLFEKLDKLDQAIRGNGKPGILLRLDRLEQDAKRQAKLLWLIIGAVLTAAASALAVWMAR